MPQRLKGLIGNTYQSWKVSRRYPLGEGGYSIKLDTGRLNPEVQPLTLLYAVFERRRYPLRAEPLRIGHYGEYPPGKTKNWQRVPPLLFVPKTFSFIVKLKRTLETFPFVHFSGLTLMPMLIPEKEKELQFRSRSILMLTKVVELKTLHSKWKSQRVLIAF